MTFQKLGSKGDFISLIKGVIRNTDGIAVFRLIHFAQGMGYVQRLYGRIAVD